MKLKFNKKKHVYTLNGKELISVTTFLKKFFNEFDEKAVAKKLHYILKSKGIHKTITEIKREWKVSREEGTLVHKEIEGCLQSNITPMHHKTKLAIEWHQKFIKGLTKPNSFTEHVIYDEELGLAGTVDLIVNHGSPEIALTIIDWKTNKTIRSKGFEKSPHALTKGEEDCNLTHYTIQLSLYAFMMERKGFKIDQLKLIHLKDDEVVEFDIPYRKELVIEMLKSEDRLK